MGDKRYRLEMKALPESWITKTDEMDKQAILSGLNAFVEGGGCATNAVFTFIPIAIVIALSFFLFRLSLHLPVPFNPMEASFVQQVAGRMAEVESRWRHRRQRLPPGEHMTYGFRL
jgi:hypothetical protein